MLLKFNGGKMTGEMIFFWKDITNMTKTKPIFSQTSPDRDSENGLLIKISNQATISFTS